MPKVAELSVEEFKSLIHDTVEESIDELFEDMLAMTSPEYLKSICEAREDFRAGRVKSFEEAFNA